MKKPNYIKEPTRGLLQGRQRRSYSFITEVFKIKYYSD